MLDIGWPEFALILIVALLVIGPRDLPKALYTVGKWMRAARRVASDFQRHVDDMIRESELEDIKKGVESARDFNVRKQIENAIDPTGDLKAPFDIKAAGRNAAGEAVQDAGTAAQDARAAKLAKAAGAPALQDGRQPAEAAEPTGANKAPPAVGKAKRAPATRGKKGAAEPAGSAEVTGRGKAAAPSTRKPAARKKTNGEATAPAPRSRAGTRGGRKKAPADKPAAGETGEPKVP